MNKFFLSITKSPSCNRTEGKLFTARYYLSGLYFYSDNPTRRNTKIGKTAMLA